MATTTFLFTDLVGSTEVLARLGDEAAEQYRRTHFRLLRESVADRGGEEVKNLGDGLMVAFPSALDAVVCAVAIQRAVVRHSRQPGEVAMEVRVGLHVGEPIREDDDYFGAAVVTAKRLCDAAEGGQVLASDLVRGLVAGRGAFSFRSLGAVPLKGFPEPLPACEVVWQEGGGPVPLPPGMAAGDAAPFVGRADAIERLRTALAEARRGSRCVVLVAGEPGVGKTRLTTEFAREAFAAGATVLYGRADEEPLAPYQPFVEALAHYVTTAPVDDLREQLGPSGHELRRLVPSLTERLPDLPEPLPAEPETERYRLFEAVLSLLDAAAAQAPVVLVLDDLHWADRPSLLLLRHLARSPGRSALLVVGAYRDVEVDRRHPLADVLADLRSEGLHERVVLRGLSAEEIVALLEVRAGHALDEEGKELAHALHAATEGNPFFIREILRHLIETGAVRQSEGRWRTDLALEQLGLPESVREVIGRRLSRLSDSCNDVLRVAAVLGHEFDLNLLERITEVTGDALLDALEEAVGARLVAEAVDGFDRYTFSHALVRETLYEELTTSRRVRLHQRAGLLLEELHVDGLDEQLGELARHFREAAVLGEVGRAVDYARRAGDRAMAQVAYEEAVVHYELGLQALELTEQPDESTRVDLLLCRGEALRATADFAAARQTFTEAAALARRLGDGGRLARAALGHGGLWVEIGMVNQDLVSLLEETSAALGASDSSLKCQVLSRHAMEVAFTPLNEQAQVLSAESVAMARRVQDEATLAYALVARRHAVTGPSRLEERLAITSESVAVAEATGEKEMALRGRSLFLIDALEAGDLEAYSIAFEAILHTASELKGPFYQYLAELLQAGAAQREGRFDEAVDRARAALLLTTRLGRVTGMTASYSLLFSAEWERGGLATIEDELRHFGDQYGAVIPAWSTVALALDAELGRLEESRARLRAIVQDIVAAAPDDWTFWLWCGPPAYAAALLGDETAAASLYDALLPFAGRHVIAGGTALVAYFGPASLALGALGTVLGRYDEAERHFAHGIPEAEAMRAPAWAARGRFEYARLLFRRKGEGDHEEGVALLERAVAEFERLGMASMLERALATQRSGS